MIETIHWMSFPRASALATCHGFWKYVLLHIFKPYGDYIIKGSASNQFIVFISGYALVILTEWGSQDTKAVEIAMSHVP